AAKQNLYHLYRANELFGTTLTVLNYQSQRVHPNSKPILVEDSRDLFQSAIEVNKHLYELTGNLTFLLEAFAMSERSKSFLLYETIKESQALLFTGIPQELLQKEYELRTGIASFEIRIQDKLSNGADSKTDSTILSISNEPFGLN